MIIFPLPMKTHTVSNVYPEAQYAYGLNAWMAQQPERAASYFRQTVSQHVLFIDAWLKLAETNVSLGRTEKAEAILTFTADVTERAIRWKWPQALLARDLAMDATSIWEPQRFDDQLSV
jgi:thioredoxin-like negative regulator of GroEL